MANMMRCAEMTGPGLPLKVMSRPVPAVPARGALVRTTHAGLCHSDIHLINDHLDLGGGRVMIYSNFSGKTSGGIPGHEIAGVIAEFGTGVDPKTCGFSIGDKVAVYPWTGCLECGPCKAGYNNMCEDNRGSTTDIGRTIIPGGFGSHVPVPEIRFLTKVPDNVPMDIACLVPCSASTSYEALCIAKKKIWYTSVVHPERPARLLVVGAGGLGLWAVRLARIVMPDHPLHITVADVDQNKLDLACEAGADKGIIWAREETAAEAAQHVICDGKIDAAIDFVGSSKTTEASIACLNKMGCFVLIGLAGGEVKLSLPPILAGGITIQGNRTMPTQTLPDVLSLIAKHNISYDHIEHVALDDINDVIERMRAGKLQGRAVICYEK